MPRRRYRTHSLRKTHVRTPGGRLVVHYEKRKKGIPKCAICKKPLAGTVRDPRDVPKSKKRPNRPYGGYLCAECLHRELTLAIIEKYSTA